MHPFFLELNTYFLCASICEYVKKSSQKILNVTHFHIACPFHILLFGRRFLRRAFFLKIYALLCHVVSKKLNLKFNLSNKEEKA